MFRTVRHFAQIRNVNPQIHNCAPHTYFLIRIQDCEKKTQFLFLETVYFLARLNLFLFNVIVGSFSTSNPLELRNQYIRPKKLLTAISHVKKPTKFPLLVRFFKKGCIVRHGGAKLSLGPSLVGPSQKLDQCIGISASLQNQHTNVLEYWMMTFIFKFWWLVHLNYSEFNAMQVLLVKNKFNAL